MPHWSEAGCCGRSTPGQWNWWNVRCEVIHLWWLSFRGGDELLGPTNRTDWAAKLVHFLNSREVFIARDGSWKCSWKQRRSHQSPFELVYNLTSTGLSISSHDDIHSAANTTPVSKPDVNNGWLITVTIPIARKSSWSFQYDGCKMNVNINRTIRMKSTIKRTTIWKICQLDER